MQILNQNVKTAYFGNSKFSAYCLNNMKASGLTPDLIITTPDRPKGRKLELTPSETKSWAITNNVAFIEQEKIRDQDFINKLQSDNFELFIVASYGKIIPKSILDMPKFSTINIHPSLLPKYRGPSPLQGQILHDDKNVGVTIMKMDEQVDHGPIIIQGNVIIPNWPSKLDELKQITAKTGADLLAKILPDWILGKITPTEQNHTEATFTKKIEKIDGLVDIVNGDPYQNFLKIQTYHLWPRAYFMQKIDDKEIRVVITEANFENDTLNITKIIPEGKKEMNYQDFLRGLKTI
jgi:methionyl-tRNA formyltransferase